MISISQTVSSCESLGDADAVSKSIAFFVDPGLLNFSILRIDDFDREPDFSSTAAPACSWVDDDVGVDVGVVAVKSNCIGPTRI